MQKWNRTISDIRGTVMELEENDAKKERDKENRVSKEEEIILLLGVQLCFRCFLIDGFSGKW